jgi:hypothetical protein
MTTATTIEVLQAAADHGLKLGFEPPDTLTFQPAERCPKDFVPILKAHKSALLALLASKGRTWIELYSERLGETVFFCEDEETRDALINAGASEWGIYTRDELRILCAQNRIAPLSATELRSFHKIKRTFNARIAE